VLPEWGLTVDDPGYIRAFANFVRTHRRVRFVSFFDGPACGAYDLGRKTPRRLPAARRCALALAP
jgi:hypothetical protein